MTDTTAAQPAPQKSEHSAPGGAVHRTGLKRRSGKLSRLPCGCESDDLVWLAFCSQIFADWRSRHSAARAAHARKAAAGDSLLE